MQPQSKSEETLKSFTEKPLTFLFAGSVQNTSSLYSSLNQMISSADVSKRSFQNGISRGGSYQYNQLDVSSARSSFNKNLRKQEHIRRFILLREVTLNILVASKSSIKALGDTVKLSSFSRESLL